MSKDNDVSATALLISKTFCDNSAIANTKVSVLIAAIGVVVAKMINLSVPQDRRREILLLLEEMLEIEINS